MQTAMMSTKVNIWLVCSALCASLVRATQSVCSSQNTATTDGVREQFQSNGWCSNNCAGHQFAIVQGYMCWCSDSEPSTQTSVGNCSGTCPGYGFEDCGNADENLFGYIYLGQTPLSSIQSVETSTAPSTFSASISTASSAASSSAAAISATSSSTLTTLGTTSLSATTTSPALTSTSAAPSTSTPTSTTSLTSTSTSTISSTSTSTSTTSSTSTSTSTISSTSTPTSTSSSTSTLTSTTSPTSTSITFTSTSPTSTSIASSTPISSSSASSASSSTSSSTTTSSIPPPPSSTTVAYTSTTTAPTTSIITSVNLQTSLKYSVITVTSVHTMDANISEITSRYLTTTKIITQVYSSVPTETPISVMTTTSVGVGGRITNSNGNSNSNNTNNNNNVPTNKSTGKKGYWHSPGKIAATFVVVGVVCLAIICVLIYLIYHYRTRPARKAQDFENAYQSKFSQSKYPNKTATATSATLHTPSPSSSSTFSTPRLIYTDEKGQITSESPSSRQSTCSLTAGSPLNDPSTLASPFHDPTLSRRASTFLHSPPTQKHHDKMESNITLGEDAVLVDQRLDPSKMLSTIASDDATTHSNISLSDNVDYSRRVLRVMNE